jgi:hypothetical protein
MLSLPPAGSGHTTTTTITPPCLLRSSPLLRDLQQPLQHANLESKSMSTPHLCLFGLLTALPPTRNLPPRVAHHASARLANQTQNSTPEKEIGKSCFSLRLSPSLLSRTLDSHLSLLPQTRPTSDEEKRLLSPSACAGSSKYLPFQGSRFASKIRSLTWPAYPQSQSSTLLVATHTISGPISPRPGRLPTISFPVAMDLPR